MDRDYHTDNKSFVMYKDWELIFSNLDSDKEVADLLRAVFAFASRGELPNFTGALKLAFALISEKLQNDGEKWEAACRTNSDNAKRAKQRNKTENLNEVQSQIEPPQATANDRYRPPAKSTDNESDNDNDYDYVYEGERGESEYKKIIQFAPEPTPSDETKRRFGEYKHVLLTEKQYNKLIEDFGKEKTAEYIRRSDEYTQQHGKIYSDYNLTIRKWIYEDAKAEKEKSSTAESAALWSSLPLPLEKLDRLFSAPYTGEDVSDLQAEFNKAYGC